MNYTTTALIYLLSTILVFGQVSDTTTTIKEKEALEKLKIALNSNDTNKKGNAFYRLAWYERQNGKLDSSLIHYYKAIQLYTQSGNEERLADVLENMAEINTYAHAYQAASNYYNDAFDIRIQLNDSSAIANYFFNQGILNRMISDYGQARKFFQEALNRYQKFKLYGDIPSTYYEIGLTFFQERKLKEAHEFLRKSIQSAKLLSDKDRKKDFAIGNLMIGLTYLTGYDTTNAVIFLNKAYKDIEFLIPENKAKLFNYLANASIPQGEEKWFELMENSTSIAKNHNLNRQYLNGCYEISKKHYELGNWQKSQYYNELHHEASNELAQLLGKLEILNNRYMVEQAIAKIEQQKIEKELEDYKREAELQEALWQRTKLEIIALTILCTLFGITLALTIKYHRRKIKEFAKNLFDKWQDY